MSSAAPGAGRSEPGEPAERPAAPSLREALGFWFKLGCIGFGGPAGQIALMHAELVERRRWISERRFLHALNYCMLLPGPEAQQLATYIGWLLHRSVGGLLAGSLFVLPSLLLITGLAWLYAAQGSHPVLQGVLYGVQPAVVALVAHAAWKLGTKALKTRLHRLLALGSLLATLAALPFPAMIAVAAAVGWLHGRRAGTAGTPAGAGATPPGEGATPPGAPHSPAWIDDDTPPPLHARFRPGRLLATVGAGIVLGIAAYAALVVWQGADGLPARMAAFFTKAALLTFGGAYAVLPYVTQAAVEQYAWLSGPQMMAGLALGESTPGPLIMIVAFVGFLGAWQQPFVDPPLLAGAIAASLVTFFTFLPSFVFILAGAPFVESTRGHAGLAAPLAAISAAVVGVIVHLGLFFAQHVFWPQGAGGGIDAIAIAIAVAAAVALLRFRRGVPEVLAVCAGLGLAISLVAR